MSDGGQMIHMKPIDTIYNGYKFRSRLEARWAVFFDAMGIEYEYEKEGYDLGRGGWYLPDFWLPQLQLWVEVKPLLRGDNDSKEIEFAKLKDLMGITTYPAMLVTGYPMEKWNALSIGDSTDSTGGHGEFYAVITLNKGYSPKILVKSYRPDRWFHTTDYDSLEGFISIPELAEEIGMSVDEVEQQTIFAVLDSLASGVVGWDTFTEPCFEHVFRAALKARQVRFEHSNREKRYATNF